MSAVTVFSLKTDFYVPTFKVVLQNQALPQPVVFDMLQVTYKDNVEEIDSFELEVNNWDAEAREFKYLDDDRFDPGHRLELWMGYRGGSLPPRLMVRGEITSLRPSFPADGGPKLTVSGLNILHKFRAAQVSAAYEKKTDVEIFQTIATRLQVDPVLARGVKPVSFNYVLQNNQYDILFLLSLARRQGYELFVQEDAKSGRTQLVYGPSDATARPALRLTYGKSLVEFQPNLSTAAQVAKVTVRGWDARAKKEINVTVDRAQLGNRGVGGKDQSGLEASFAEREEVITDTPVHTEEEARALARETLSRNAKELVTGSGSTVGLPDIRAGGYVEIDGLGSDKRYNGRYFVTASTHTIGDSGYTTQFECRREPA